MKIYYKKGLGSVIAISLLLIITVISISVFQTWFITYQSNINTNVETKSNNLINSNGIEAIVDNKLYFNNKNDNNISINKVVINNINCDISKVISSGVEILDISKCLKKVTSQTANILVLTKNKVYEKQIYLDSDLTLIKKFISLWNVSIDTGVSGFNNLTLPLQSNGTYNFTVDWGDGSSSFIDTWDSINKTHNYNVGGEYIVTINGDINGFAFNAGDTYDDNRDDGDKLIDIMNWGTLKISNTGEQFSNCENLINFSATDQIMNLNEITNMYGMFYSATKFNGNINNWDISNVNVISKMFKFATSFNQPLNNWDISNVNDLSEMFYSATSFNQPLNNWDISNVNDLSGMFYSATSFNQPLNNWNTSNVNSMIKVFKFATSFNQPLNNWDISNVNNLSGMFYSATSFNQSLNNWNVLNVNDISSIFHNATSFNQPLNNWNTSNVNSMIKVFKLASNFNQSISTWNVGNVTNMDEMFRSANSYSNHNMSAWNVSKVISHINFNQSYGSGNIDPIWI